jgi:hypothetical protein
MERAMRFCTLCSHQLRQQIDELLLLHNTSFRNIAERFRLSLGAISRHRSHCLRAALQSRTTESAETVLSRVERLQQRTEKILDAAERDDDRMIALAGIREARRNYELLGRLNGELDQKQAAARNTGGERLSIEVVFQLPNACPNIDNSPRSAIIDVSDSSREAQPPRALRPPKPN